jgi:hypothetical protein
MTLLVFTLGGKREPEKGALVAHLSRETNPDAGKGCQKVWYHPTAESSFIKWRPSENPVNCRLQR